MFPSRRRLRGEGHLRAVPLGCDVQEGGRRHTRGGRRRARVRQRGVRQGARAAAAAVFQVQGRGLLLQGVPTVSSAQSGRTSPYFELCDEAFTE